MVSARVAMSPFSRVKVFNHCSAFSTTLPFVSTAVRARAMAASRVVR